MKCERARRGCATEVRRRGGGRTFNKLSHSEGDKHQVSSVSGFHCESSKLEGSSLRRQLFHSASGGVGFLSPEFFSSAVSPPFPTAKMQNSLGEQQRPD